MIFSALFKKNNIKELWSYKTKGILWRLTFSHTGFIVGEDRDSNKKIVTYFCVNSINGDVLWREYSYCDPYWCGVKGVIDDKLFIHGFRKPNMPEQYKIVVVDLGTGNELWSRNDVSVNSANKNEVCCTRDYFEKRVYYLLDIKNGELISESDGLPEYFIPNSEFNGKTDFQYPVPTLINFEIQRIIDSQISLKNVEGSFEVITKDNLTLCSFHKRESDLPSGELNFSNYFVIIDNLKNKLIYKTILNSSTPNIVPDSYFMDKNVLYLLKEKNTLAALDISNL